MNKDLEFLASILNESNWPEDAAYVRLDSDSEVCFAGTKTNKNFYPDDLDAAVSAFIKPPFRNGFGQDYQLRDILHARDEIGINNKKKTYTVDQVIDELDIRREVNEASIALGFRQWQGPEDGLPPVGTVLEAWFDDGRCCWHKAYVVGYHPSEANTLAVSLMGDHESRLIWSDTNSIRPDRTEEAKVVEEMMESGAIGAFFGASNGAICDAAFEALFRHMVRNGYSKGKE